MLRYTEIFEKPSAHIHGIRIRCTKGANIGMHDMLASWPSGGGEWAEGRCEASLFFVVACNSPQ